MPARSEAQAITKTPFNALLLFFITLMPLAMQYVTRLPLCDLDKALVDGTVVGTQILMIVSLYRQKTRKN
ncbi:hypothetical protein ACE4RV_03980 [Acetobacter persici]|uniref:hypothetical protein n=1 Tax=Acetobacter persici TaxID=1076596 RepID=UPI0036D9CC75